MADWVQHPFGPQAQGNNIVISHLVIYGGIGFVIACVVAVKYGPWFKKTSTQVTNAVDNAADNIKNVVKKDGTSSNNS